MNPLIRTAAVALAREACNDYNGRRRDDPRYVEVTENEHGNPREMYSSCGDLPHWMLRRLGCRALWTNHGPLWRPGKNISLLANPPCPSRWAPFGPDWCPEPGDVLIVWNDTTSGLTKDAHALVYLGPHPTSPGMVETANYGSSGMTRAMFPGCKVKAEAVRYLPATKVWLLGQKRVQRWLSLADVPFTTRPNLEGACLPGDVVDALEEPFRGP